MKAHALLISIALLPFASLASSEYQILVDKKDNLTDRISIKNLTKKSIKFFVNQVEYKLDGTSGLLLSCDGYNILELQFDLALGSFKSIDCSSSVSIETKGE